MRVITAETAGFCFGVRRAVDMVYEQAGRGRKVYTYGEIIHNEEVVAALQKEGVEVIHSIEELRALQEGVVVIRSHGVGREVYRIIEEKENVEMVDATCPFVAKIHEIVERESRNGSFIIVIGDKKHPEVEGITGFADGDYRVIGDEAEAENFSIESGRKVCVVSQTTFNTVKFKYLVDIINKKCYTTNTVNTICSATEQRQKEAAVIASEADVMIVIGGRGSSNSRKLYEICSERCNETYFIQTLADLNLDFPKSVSCVGITAGASTPNYIIEEVQSYVRGQNF